MGDTITLGELRALASKGRRAVLLPTESDGNTTTSLGRDYLRAEGEEVYVGSHLVREGDKVGRVIPEFPRDYRRVISDPVQ